MMAQYTIKGQVMDDQGIPVEGVTVSINNTDLVFVTGSDGKFNISDIEKPQIELNFFKEDWNGYLTEVKMTGEQTTKEMGVITMTKISAGTGIPVISLSETEVEQEEGFENISGLLSAGNDPFAQAAAFNFGAARFKMRGYKNNSTQTFINGS
ncbi:MAG: carboxypeptidase-like regulatory domain-containing protein, partial [Saprospiraceae bacterium]